MLLVHISRGCIIATNNRAHSSNRRNLLSLQIQIDMSNRDYTQLINFHYHISPTAKILIFYVIFYAALAGFFAAIFAVFYQTLDPHQPKWKLNDGLIGNNPGLGFRPMPDDSNVESTLIWFEAANKGNTKHWIGALDEFLTGELDECCTKDCRNKPSIFHRLHEPT
jgi:Sodium / potassium ATPase beta chain